MKREKNLRKINDFNFFPVCVQEICDLLELCGKENNSNNFHLLNESEDKIDDWKWFDNRIIQNTLINSTQIKIMLWGNINNDTQKYSSIEHRMKYSLIDSQPIANDCFFFRSQNIPLIFCKERKQKSDSGIEKWTNFHSIHIHGLLKVNESTANSSFFYAWSARVFNCLVHFFFMSKWNSIIEYSVWIFYLIKIVDIFVRANQTKNELKRTHALMLYCY